MGKNMTHDFYYSADTGTPKIAEKSDTSGMVESLPYKIGKSTGNQVGDGEDVPKEEEQKHYKKFFKTNLA